MSRSKINIDPETGLTPQQEVFSTALARGLSQADAWRLAHPDSRASNKTVWEKASKMAADARVKARVRALLKEAKITDIDNVARAWRDLLGDLRSARDCDNFTAVSNLTRQRLTGLGALERQTTVDLNIAVDDRSLVDRLAKGDPAKRVVLQSCLGAEDFEDVSLPDRRETSVYEAVGG